MTKKSEEKKKRKRLAWEYCECGCGGFSLSIGPLPYWVDINDKNRIKKFLLLSGHGWSGKEIGGKFNSWRDVDRAVLEHAKPLLKESGADLRRQQRELAKAMSLYS